MKTIILFSRLDYTDLLVPLGKALEPRVRVVHLAYSETEAARLRELNIGGPITVFKDEVRRLYTSSSVDQTKLVEIDELFIRESHGTFNLNGAIQSDRGFKHLTLEEAQQLTFTYYRFWTEFLRRYDANLVFHETCSLMFNFVACMVCSARGGHYLYTIMAQGPGKGLYHLTMSGFEFECMDLDRALTAVKDGRLQVDEAKCVAFLTESRNDASIFLGSSFKKPLLTRLAAVALYKWAKRRLCSNPYHRVLENIDYWEFGGNLSAEKLHNLRAYRGRVRFDIFDATQPYFFYPMHLEPEAVVLYHAHGLYSNQVKLMQNIAAQLPPGVFLYVKDHPHDQGYRSVEDYLALKAIPNIKLLESHLPGKQIVAHSLGVITLTGTAGFEALLLGKRVFTFGKTLYSNGPGVVYLRNVRELREAIYRSLAQPEITETDLYRYLTAYLAALRPGLVDYFSGRAQRYGIDLEKNAYEVANGLLATLQGPE